MYTSRFYPFEIIKNPPDCFQAVPFNNKDKDRVDNKSTDKAGMADNKDKEIKRQVLQADRSDDKNGDNTDGRTIDVDFADCFAVLAEAVEPADPVDSFVAAGSFVDFLVQLLLQASCFAVPLYTRFFYLNQL